MLLFVESIRSALASIRAHRLRSFLTSLGIIIGVASVITVVSLIQGLSKSVTSQFEGLGSNSLTVRAHNEYKDLLRGKSNTLKFDDVEQLRTRVKEIRDISPVFSPGQTDVRFGGSSGSARVMAATTSYQDVQQRYAQTGRFINKSDELSSRRVAVIGEKLIETLHLPSDPIGQFVQFSDEWFKIIGVLEKRGDLFGSTQDDYLIIPYSTGQSIIGNIRRPNMLMTISIRDLARVDAAKAHISAVLRAAHRLRPEDKDDFEIESADQLAKTFSKISTTVTLVMAGVVGIALLVGGIGIMNIMLVSVTERTREIGICKAIGARNRDIMMQFLIEAVVLSVLGGLIGLVLGYVLGVSIAKSIPDFPDAFVPWWAITLALAFSTAMGIFFGVFPARKAARLDPIDALRYE